MAVFIPIPHGVSVEEVGVQPVLQAPELADQGVYGTARGAGRSFVHGDEHEAAFQDAETGGQRFAVSCPPVKKGGKIVFQRRNILGRKFPVGTEAPEPGRIWK